MMHAVETHSCPHHSRAGELPDPLSLLTLWLSVIAAVRTGLSFNQIPALDIERMMDAIERAVGVPEIAIVACTVLRGGRSLANAHHWQRVLRMNMSPLTHLANVDRPLVAAALRRPGSWARSASIPHRSSHSGSEVHYGRSDRGSPAATSAATCDQTASLKSQTIPRFQYVSGQTLTLFDNIYFTN